MVAIAAPVVERTVTSRDGTAIRYYLVGRGPGRWLMPPAMGAPLLAMSGLFEPLQHEYTFVTWDMRGFHGSAAPAEAGAYAVDYHLDDLAAVERAAGLERFVLGGWSMGVQLSLERYRRSPREVRALVLVSGAFERVLDAIHPRLASVIAGTLLRARHAAPLANRLTRRIDAAAAARAMTRLGLLARRSARFEAVFAEFRKVHWGRYATVMAQLHEHSARPYLREVSVPTLITAGGRDRMTPLAVAEALHGAIAGSELFVIPEATHYLPIEFASELAERVAVFLGRLEP